MASSLIIVHLHVLVIDLISILYVFLITQPNILWSFPSCMWWNRSWRSLTVIFNFLLAIFKVLLCDTADERSRYMVRFPFTLRLSCFLNLVALLRIWKLVSIDKGLSLICFGPFLCFPGIPTLWELSSSSRVINFLNFVVLAFKHMDSKIQRGSTHSLKIFEYVLTQPHPLFFFWGGGLWFCNNHLKHSLKVHWIWYLYVKILLWSVLY